MQASVGSASAPYLRAIRRHWLVVLMVALVALGAAVGWAKARSHRYQFTARILVTPIPAGDPTLAGLAVLHDSGDPATTIQTAAALVDSETAARTAAARLGPDWSPTRVHSAVTVAPEGGSNLVDVTATASDRATAAQVANTFAQASLDARNASLQQQIASALRALQSEQASLGNQTPSGAGAGSLSERITSLEGERGISDPTLSLTQPAAPATVAGSSTKKIAVLALLAGLLLGCAAAILIDALDGTVRDESDVTEAYALPVLAHVPGLDRRRPRSSARRGGAPMPSAMAAALNELLLQLEHPGRDHRTIMVTSPSAGDGTTTIAVGLALMAAAGGTDVALIECDLRRPSIASRMRLADCPVVEDLLAADVDVAELMRRAPTLPSLSVLAIAEPIGAATSIEQIAVSERAARRLPELVREAALTNDLVVLDTSPLAESGDGLRLLADSDDVLVVARLHKTKRSALKRCGDLMRRAGRIPRGIVLTGVGGGREQQYDAIFSGDARSSENSASGSREDPAVAPAFRT
jgi:Mrp family chromosome partitioning ATPase